MATQRGERRLEGQATWNKTAAFHLFILIHPLLLLSASFSPLPFLLSPTSFSGTGFGTGLVFLDSFPPSLSSHLPALSFAAMVTTSSLHEVHLQRTQGGRERRVISVQQNMSSSVRASIGEHVTCHRWRETDSQCSPSSSCSLFSSESMVKKQTK